MVALEPEHPSTAYHCGRLLAVIEDVQRAAQAYQKAIRLDPENADSYYNLGRLYLEQDLVEQGEAMMAEYRRLSTAPVEAD